MSTVYATEPPPSGSVLLETTHGPLSIELFCREVPTWTRLFLQLIVDEYYQGSAFHRVIPNTLIQCGAIQYPKSSSKKDKKKSASSSWTVDSSNLSQWKDYAQEQLQISRALDRRRLELNSRLRFSHRGLVAMALPLEQDETDDEVYSLAPQFFITLEETSYLDGKHVLIGRVTGPTVFNALRIGQVNVEEGHLDEAPRITHAKIVDNPLRNSLQPTATTPWKQADESATKKKKRKRKGKLDVNVLSFGDEFGGQEEDADEVDPLLPRKMKSVHDDHVSSSSQKEKSIKRSHQDKGNLLNDAETTKPVLPKLDREQTSQIEEVHKAAGPDSALTKGSSPNKSEAASQKETTKEKPKKVKKRKLNGASLLEAMRSKAQYQSAAPRKEKSSSQQSNSTAKDQATLSKLMAFSNRLGGGGPDSTKKDASVDPNDNSLAARMARKAQQEQQAANNNSNNDDSHYHGQVLEVDPSSQDYDPSWMSQKFTCRKHVDQFDANSGADGRQMDDYEVVDDAKGDNQRDNRNRSHGHHRSGGRRHDSRDHRGGRHRRDDRQSNRERGTSRR